MTGQFTGTDAGNANLTITDGTTTGFGINKITVSGGDLTSASNGEAVIDTSGAGGGGTVTSITPAGDNGAGTAITGTGTITIAGGTNITTNIVGTTITINGDSGTIATGVANQVAYYTGTDALGGNTGLTFDPTDASVALTANSAGSTGLTILNGGAGAPQLTIGDSTINDAGSIMDIVGNTNVRIRPGTTPTAGNDKTVSVELKDSAGSLKEYMTALTTTGQKELSFNNDAADIDFRVATVAQTEAFKIDAAAETANFNVPLTLGTDLAIADGGTGASNAGGARTNLSAASSGANSDITSLSTLTSLTVSDQINSGTATGVGLIRNYGATQENGFTILTNPITEMIDMNIYGPLPNATTVFLLTGDTPFIWLDCPLGEGYLIRIANATGTANGAITNVGGAGSLIDGFSLITLVAPNSSITLWGGDPVSGIGFGGGWRVVGDSGTVTYA